MAFTMECGDPTRGFGPAWALYQDIEDDVNAGLLGALDVIAQKGPTIGVVVPAGAPIPAPATPGPPAHAPGGGAPGGVAPGGGAPGGGAPGGGAPGGGAPGGGAPGGGAPGGGAPGGGAPVSAPPRSPPAVQPCAPPSCGVNARGHCGKFRVADEPDWREHVIFIGSQPGVVASPVGRDRVLAYVTVTNAGPRAMRLTWDQPPPGRRARRGATQSALLLPDCSTTLVIGSALTIDYSPNPATTGAEALGHYVVSWCCPDFPAAPRGKRGG
jgi:hypothetical protein